MNIALLTTETVHHAYFARQLLNHFPLRGIFLETRGVLASVETTHPFERKRDVYERAALAGSEPATIAGLAETWEFESVNRPEAVETLRALKPDVVLLFGTGKVTREVYRSAACACLNLHGGNPEYYRGFDSHLWAVYHEDFANLITTLHQVDDHLDTGDIVLQATLDLEPSTELHELRAINTRACVNLSLMALHAVSQLGYLPSRRQFQVGRYYSFMPAVLKDACVAKLRRHLAGH